MGTVKADAYVALLRGINMGGHKKLPMTELVALFEAAGCGDVRTYINSGNVLFSASPRVAEWLPGALEKAIADGFGFTAPIVLRTAKEMARVVADNPFLRQGRPHDTLSVLFLAHTPDPARIAALDPARSPGDEFAVHGREVYLSVPNGVARSKLTNDYFDRALKTTCTGRNWRTVLRLVELAGP